MKVAILQSCYIPWKGYFDQINSVDTFVLYDCVQFTRRDWRNRNKIKTPHGTKWLSIPVSQRGKFDQKISETEVESSSWANEHYLSLKHHYSKAAFFKHYEAELEETYKRASEIKHLSQINQVFLETICNWLSIETPLVQSSEFKLREGKSERLLGICQDLNADTYISGPAAKDYLDAPLFNSHNISVEWADYSIRARNKCRKGAVNYFLHSCT